MRKKLLLRIAIGIVCASLPAAVIITAGFRAYKQRWPAMIKKEAAAQNAKWAKYNYVPIADASITNELEQLISSKINGDQLPADQKLSLTIELTSFFRAYSQGKYKSYKNFRMPAGVSFVWNEDNKLGPIDNILDRLGLPKSLHYISMERKFYAYLIAANGNGFVYSNLFTDISFEQSSIIVQQYKNPIPILWKTSFFLTNYTFPEHLPFSKKVVTAFPNTTFVSQKEFSYIKYDQDSIENIENQFGDVTTADCFFFIKRRDPYPILPVIIRLYWDPKVKDWLPDDVVVCDYAQESVPSVPIF